jgi:hypothetical protein
MFPAGFAANTMAIDTFGYIFASTSNSIPAAMLVLMRILADPRLPARIEGEMQAVRGDGLDFVLDSQTLAQLRLINGTLIHLSIHGRVCECRVMSATR